jgi:hypothetical protein
MSVIEKLFEKYEAKEFYDRLSKTKDQYDHKFQWQLELYKLDFDEELLKGLYKELFFDHDLVNHKKYIDAFPILKNDKTITYSPLLEGAIHFLEDNSLPNSFFFEEQYEFTRLIIENFENNNLDLFEDPKEIAKNIDWEEYVNTRINLNRMYPSEDDVDLLLEFEDIILSKKIKGTNHKPIQEDTFVILTGFGFVFSEHIYREIFENTLAISTNNTREFIIDIVKIEENPYLADNEYYDLLFKYKVNTIKSSSHLGFAKLNSFLRAIDYFELISQLY